MKTFKDNENREYSLTINVSALERIRDNMGVNLGDRTKILDTLDKLINDDLFVVQAAYECLRPELDKRSISRDAFVNAMSGDVIDRAAIALRESLIDFFRSPAIRRVIVGMVEKYEQMKELATQEALTSLSTATGSPASSESIQPG